MKCIACGKENVQDARFCAFCGAGIPAQTPVSEETPQPEIPAARQTARPLSDNPYQRHRAPVIPSAQPAAAESEASPEAVHESPSPRRLITPSPKRVFLFEEEEDEQRRAEAKEAAKKVKLSRPQAEDDEEDEELAGAEDEDFSGLDDPEDFDEFDEFEYDDSEEDDDPYEEDVPSAGRIFVRIFSVLTVLVLIAGVIAFMYGTAVGRRLRASMGMSGKAGDYLILADWQLQQNSLASASDSYYNAFKLAQDDFELALTVGKGFENCGDDTRAEQMYTYLITAYPQADEPYDRLMAILNKQGRIEQYESLLTYREEHQPGYVPPALPAPETPIASHQSGAYVGSIQLTLTASGAEIRYTLDGTAPTAGSLLYTGPVMLTKGTHNVRAVAVQGGEISAEWTGSFVIS